MTKHLIARYHWPERRATHYVQVKLDNMVVSLCGNMRGHPNHIKYIPADLPECKTCLRLANAKS